MRLLLFDIDGTLLSCGPQVRPLFTGALQEVFGQLVDGGGVLETLVDGYDFAGKTDPQIIFDLLAAAGMPRPEIGRRLDIMRRRYTARLEAGLERRGMRLMPGVRELVGELSGRRELTLGLLTGNWRAGARSKLARFDLNEPFPFGAFGDDGVKREELVPVALERAAAHRDETFHAEETLIIGDSIHDVACARAHGVKVLAVATGTTPATALEEAGADWVVDDLPAARRLLPVLA